MPMAALLTLIELASRWTTGLLFLYAGIRKTLDTRGFTAAIGRYGLINDRLGRILARLLPPIEICCGLLLVFGQFTAIVSVASLTLLLTFSWAILVSMHRGRRGVDCGCGLVGASTIGYRAVVRDLALALMTCYTFLFAISSSTPRRYLLGEPWGKGDAIAAMASVVVFIVLTKVTRELLRLCTLLQEQSTRS
jgi:uncharacterized membrane protein YphA (DoxX/SURF4 family)